MESSLSEMVRDLFPPDPEVAARQPLLARTDFQSHELYWLDTYEWYRERGYLLPQRYHPGWLASLVGTGERWQDHEEGYVFKNGFVVDACRDSDNAQVILKLVRRSVHDQEVEITRHLSTGDIAADPRNHTIQIDDILHHTDHPNIDVIVMPLLRPFDDPPFDTIGEVVDCIGQIFEGLEFMHSHHVAHRDCHAGNILLDSRRMYPQGFHPRRKNRTRDLRGRAKHYTRTSRPPRYCLIDFGLSRRYRAEDTNPMEPLIPGGDKTLPETRNRITPCNPFANDVYYVGNWVRQSFLEGMRGFGFLAPLIDEMVVDDPSARPSMEQVLLRFNSVKQGLSTWTLRSRAVRVDEGFVSGLWASVGHWARRIRYVVTRTPALPTP
ncbi:hypothetical protein PUNSTDRAFT_54638 [Punctularia strigosozonata HHB-11173 SS5]|uniref:uncharacterized protein n=1 Tax=Punctularia strigosozonata (strain HHB-11173) TaxID=741275 RepID=UPI000441853A|nr:uncharacterized protein PUNSTDRAFT_54638 [Punctularia strigosozonata HHB-11173 SS5]EIN05741.1 hypothetical protein PUNSTDRAFT_54638 [Punctularia strigosozonata HHB-11173 SS5]